ncbi:MAG: sporulation protein YunB [Firmicutes bacterium]|nr:sporulation protein YunB [Bacillota bacterium]
MFWLGVAGVAWIALLVGSFAYVETTLRPNLSAIAQMRAKVVVIQAINQVILKDIMPATNSMQLFTVQQDSSGNVTVGTVNTVEAEHLSSETAVKVQERLDQMRNEPIQLPLGQATGSAILSQLGPRIPISLVPYGAVQVDTVPRERNVGINQAVIEVDLNVTAQIQIVMPFITNIMTIQNPVPVAYAILPGQVPGVFLQPGSTTQIVPGVTAPSKP